MHSNFTEGWVLHRKFSAQKSYAQKVLRTTFFTYRLSYTDAFTRKTNCTQHTSTRNQLLHREVLLPLLDHLPFVFPLSSMPWGMVINPLIGMYIVHDEDFHYEMSDHITTIRQLIIYIPLCSSLLVDYIPLQNYIPIKHANGHMHADSMLPCQGVGTQGELLDLAWGPTEMHLTLGNFQQTLFTQAALEKEARKQADEDAVKGLAFLKPPRVFPKVRQSQQHYATLIIDAHSLQCSNAPDAARTRHW